MMEWDKDWRNKKKVNSKIEFTEDENEREEILSPLWNEIRKRIFNEPETISYLEFKLKKSH